MASCAEEVATVHSLCTLHCKDGAGCAMPKQALEPGPAVHDITLSPGSQLTGQLLRKTLCRAPCLFVPIHLGNKGVVLALETWGFLNGLLLSVDK